MSQFKIPPISTLSGSTLGNYLRVLKQGRIEPRYYLKTFLTLLIVLISTPFHWWERLYYGPKLKKHKFFTPPVFILGHWRSGTTMLHNLICSDPDAAYLTTYQSVFPNNLASKLIFKTFMRINTPEKRPSDNVRLDVNFPQEDEFAFANTQPYAYYNFFYFPENYREFYQRGIKNEGLSKKELDLWYRKYDELLRKAQINTGKPMLVVKNPANTARIKQLLKLYPDARFIYIYRDPVKVFLSTEKFFKSLFPTLVFHDVDDQFIRKLIFDVYKRLLDDYHRQKDLIPKENLIEVAFEDLEKEPLKYMERIYRDLLKRDMEKARPHFEAFAANNRSYVKNKYEIPEDLQAEIIKEMGKYMKLYGYFNEK